MPHSFVRHRDIQILKLEGAVAIGDAQDLAAGLRRELEESLPLRVETGSLEAIDTSVLQLLCALRRTVPELSFDRPSEAFAAAVERRGLRRELLNAPEGS